MFMMPMPPTSRLTAAMAASRAVRVFGGPLEGVGDLLHVAHIEVVLAAAAFAAALAKQGLDVRFDPRAGAVLDGRDVDHADVSHAEHALLDGLERHHDEVVFVAAKRSAFLGEHADDLTGGAADTK